MFFWSIAATVTAFLVQLSGIYLQLIIICAATTDRALDSLSRFLGTVSNQTSCHIPRVYRSLTISYLEPRVPHRSRMEFSHDHAAIEDNERSSLKM
jgi:hypothetical protein